jgi:integrase
MRPHSEGAQKEGAFVTPTCNTLGVALINQRGANMATLTGLFQRGSSYYLRVVLPPRHPLQPKYKNGQYVVSLGPCSYREAVQRGAVTRAGVLYGADPVSNRLSPPLVDPVVSKSTHHSLRDIHGIWTSSKARSQDTIDACLRSVCLYEEFTGNLPIEKLTREVGGTFRAWLEHPDRKTTSKTARDRLIWVKSLLQFSAQDLRLIPQSPWAGIDIEFRTTNKRRPWTQDELLKLFDQPLHKAYKLPTNSKAGKDAAYWIPLLGLYTGARLGELAQLRVIDVHIDGSVPMLSITSQGDGQRVKTKAGLRSIPIHSELIRLGFLDFVEKAKKGSNDSFWPDLPKREGKPGGYFSHWFSEYRNSLGFDKAPDFHCFRHTVRTQMAEAGIPEAVIDTLVGHEISGSVGAKVYTHRTSKTLSEAIEVLNNPALKHVLTAVCLTSQT